MLNPFNIGYPVLPHKMVGRSDQVKKIVSDLLNDGGHSHAVIGGRRFGKTSFLDAVQYSLVQQLNQPKKAGDVYVLPVLIDLKNLYLTKISEENVFGLMVYTIHKCFTDVNIRETLDIHINLNLEETSLSAFIQNNQNECTLQEFAKIIRELLNIFSNSYGLLQFVFLIDEIELILENDWAKILFTRLRILIYNKEFFRNNIRYVIVGSSQLIDVKEKGSPLLNMMKILYLEALHKEEIREIINWASDVPLDVANAVQQQCGGHPFIAQYLMHYLWENDLSTATTATVIGLAKKFTRDRHFDLDRWVLDIGEAGQLAYGFLAESNKLLLEAEIRQHLNKPNLKIGHGLIALCYHGLAIQDGTWSRYHVTGELFKDWFMHNLYPGLDIPKPSTRRPSPDPTTTPKAKDEFRYDAFISYSHEDSSWVKDKLLRGLENEGLPVCIDYRDFEPGRLSLTNMEDAVAYSRKTLLVLTPNWIASEWAKFESLLLQVQDPTNQNQRFLPLLVQPCQLPGRLEIFTHLDFTKPTEFDRQMQRLVAAIRGSSG